ncbi:hypothetical protein C6W23_20055 [Bacillus atrophaeus]|nr:hypothetical protein C6W23_20055 [Bacillus atrophaeus]
MTSFNKLKVESKKIIYFMRLKGSTAERLHYLISFNFLPLFVMVFFFMLSPSLVTCLLLSKILDFIHLNLALKVIPDNPCIYSYIETNKGR